MTCSFWKGVFCGWKPRVHGGIPRNIKILLEDGESQERDASDDEDAIRALALDQDDPRDVKDVDIKPG